MGSSGDDTGCPARNYIERDNGRLNLSAVAQSDSRSAFLGISLSTASFLGKRLTWRLGTTE
jgi:hypothetical protein